ncbi:MAG: hypothetical protein HFE78_08680, partial [Clostridiales bacterium]|nr:hypothetical protein [Clostridiales bacterium]
FGYVVEVKGIEAGKPVSASVTNTSWGHDNEGQQGGGWYVTDTQQYTLTQDGVYTFLVNGYQTQTKIQRPNRIFLLWVRQFDIKFDANVSMRVLAQVEATADSTDYATADCSSPAVVTYHKQDGSIHSTQTVNTHAGYTSSSTATPVMPGVPLDCSLASYTNNGVTYEHSGWSFTKDARKPDVAYVYGNMDVYPVFTATGVPFATFYSEDGSEEYGQEPIIPGQALTTDIKPEKDLGDEYVYTFDYWTDDSGNKVDLSAVTDEISLYAHFKKELKSHTVYVYSVDGRTVKQMLSVKHGEALTGLTAPTLEGDKDKSYQFDKWVYLSDGQEADFSSILSDIEIRPEYNTVFINRFTDVKENDWFRPAVEYTVLNKIMFGAGDFEFEPETPTTRAMFAAVLYRMEGSRDVSALPSLPFTDVPSTEYYANAVRWAYNAGVVAGSSKTTFSPNNYITREEMAAMLYRYAAKVRFYDMSIDEKTDFSGFIDGDNVTDYATDAMKWMIQDSRKYMSGSPAGDDVVLEPQGKSTRAMMASVMQRFLSDGDRLAEEFANPSDEFTPIPFWFWNDQLTEEEISRQMHAFNEKGVNGFVIHPRLGLTDDIVYMDESWMHYVRYAVELATELNMKVFLYDEAMYPSGSCNGQVVKENPEYASKGIKISTSPDIGSEEKILTSFTRGGETYYVILAYSYGTIRGVYYGQDDNQPGAPRSADLLNPNAVASFIRLTHQKYYDELKDYFGNTILAIFTDEPSILGRMHKGNLLAWTDDLMEDMKAVGVKEEELYYLFYEQNSTRGRTVNDLYDQVVYDRLKTVYYGQIASWCKEHGIALTGHPGSSMDIGLLSEFDIPCQDIVWHYLYPGEASMVNGEHSTMGKAASDSARHTGKRRNGNECFGVCGHYDDPYAFTRSDMKWYIDWLFARGCNLIIPHAFYYSLRDARKDERPPEVGMHSEFWDEYKEISDYIKRCSAMNTDSINITDIAVLCTKDYLPSVAVKPMYENQIEFNYLEDSLLKTATLEKGAIKIANQSYRVVVLDRTYDSDTMAFLEKFKQEGGTVITYSQYAGNPTSYVNMLRSKSYTALRIQGDEYLRMTHIRKYGKDVLFFTNEGEDALTATLNEKVDEIWDAETGVMMKNYSGDTYTISLKPRQSVYLILK